MFEATVAAGLVRGLMELAVSRGASREMLGRRSHIDPRDLHDQDNRVAFAKYVALMRVAKELCHDPALALHFGEATDLADMSIVGLLSCASETVADAVAQMNRYGRLAVEVDCVGTGERFALTRGRGELWLVDTRENPNHSPEVTESTFARIVCATRPISATQLVKAVHVTHPAPDYRAEYARVFRATVVFASDKNALLLDQAWLTQRIGLSQRYVFGIFSAYAQGLLESLESSKSTRGRVERLLMPILHTGEVSMAGVAGQLAFSRQTLFRRLRAEGVTFKQVLDDLRRRMALHYLSATKAAVNETAYLVGFSDPAAFSRAFKRWTGSNPRRMRREHAMP